MQGGEVGLTASRQSRDIKSIHRPLPCKWNPRTGILGKRLATHRRGNTILAAPCQQSFVDSSEHDPAHPDARLPAGRALAENPAPPCSMCRCGTAAEIGLCQKALPARPPCKGLRAHQGCSPRPPPDNRAAPADNACPRLMAGHLAAHVCLIPSISRSVLSCACWQR